MKWQPYLAVSMALALTGCSAHDVPEPAPAQEVTEAAPTAAEPDPYAEVGDITNLEPLAVGPYRVRALHIGEIALGHFNLYVEGDDPAAVRAWVGDEAATDVVVTLAEFEVDHHCAHLEVPTAPPRRRAVVGRDRKHPGRPAPRTESPEREELAKQTKTHLQTIRTRANQ